MSILGDHVAAMTISLRLQTPAEGLSLAYDEKEQEQAKPVGNIISEVDVGAKVIKNQPAKSSTTHRMAIGQSHYDVVQNFVEVRCI